MSITIQSVVLSVHFSIMTCITLIIVYTYVLIVVLIHVEAVSQNESLSQFVWYVHVVLLVMINNISLTLLHVPLFLISVHHYFLTYLTLFTCRVWGAGARTSPSLRPLSRRTRNSNPVPDTPALHWPQTLLNSSWITWTAGSTSSKISLRILR